MNLPTAIIGALGMILASAFTSWASSNSAVADIRTQVVQVTERENNHYQQLTDSINRIEKKLDMVIDKKMILK